MSRLRFGPFSLLRDGTDVPLGRRAFGVLCQLAQRSGQVIPKDDLLATVWRGLAMEEARLHVQVSRLRKAIGTEVIVAVSGVG